MITDKIPVTVVIPVLNEEINLPACLQHLSSFEETIVVDSRSKDRSREIAAQAGAKVIDFIWDGKFPKKRNWILRSYTFKTLWVLFLDADEQLTPSFLAELRSAISKPGVNGYWIRYSNYFMHKKLRFGVPQRKLSLFKLGFGEYEHIPEIAWSRLDMEVHEHPQITGEVGYLRSEIIHHDYRDLHHFLDRHNQYSTWEANRYVALVANKVSWRRLTIRQKIKYSLLSRYWFGFLYFLFTYIVRAGFLDGSAGLQYAILKANYFHQIALKIRELSVCLDKSRPRT